MKTASVMRRFKQKKPVLHNPVSDDQQLIIDERIDTACRIRLNLNPTDPRAIPYLRSALWLWK